MMPTRVPSGRNTQMPPGPVQYTRPVLSTFSPSGMPGRAPSFMSAKMRRPVMLPAASSAMAWTYFDERVFATYSVRSSGENARPLGYSQCASTLTRRSGATRYTHAPSHRLLTPAGPGISRAAYGMRLSGSVK